MALLRRTGQAAASVPARDARGWLGISGSFVPGTAEGTAAGTGPALEMWLPSELGTGNSQSYTQWLTGAPVPSDPGA
jgi:hypothetical protein